MEYARALGSECQQHLQPRHLAPDQIAVALDSVPACENPGSMKTDIRTSFVLFALLLSNIVWAEEPVTTSTATDGETTYSYKNAIDRTVWMKPKAFSKSGAREYGSKWMRSEFAFDELIYCWNARLQRDQGFRLFLQVQFPDKQESPWMYAGFWAR